VTSGATAQDPRTGAPIDGGDPWRTRVVDSLAVLRAEAARWDDLWQRSEVSHPCMQAALIANWVDQFQAGGQFRAVVVEHERRLMAALPLVTRRIGGLLRIGVLPNNEWASSGDLLLDPLVDVDRALDSLLAGLAGLPWPLVQFDQVPYETPRWQAFLAACRRAGRPTSIREHFQVGQVAIAADWQAYEAALCGDLRRDSRRRSRLLAREGPVELRIFRPTDQAEIRELVGRGFDVEDRSWKGTAGSSVLRAPGMLAFFQRKACLLADRDQLELCFYEYRDRPIAFIFCCTAKGVFYTPKVGYDAGMKKFAPGRLLLRECLKRLHEDGQDRLLDFDGPLAPWSSYWMTHSYPVGRLVVAGPGRLDRALFHALTDWYPQLKGRRDSLRRSRAADVEAPTAAV
jgi:CelD/BcsL family acetyltransferase involved in cellulose biosynthesis